MAVYKIKIEILSCLAILSLVCCTANGKETEQYGQGQNGAFSDYIAEDAKMTQKDKDYQREVKASWPKVTNYSYVLGGISYPSVSYNLDTSSIALDTKKVNSVSLVQQIPVLTADPFNFQTGMKVFALQGAFGYKWEKFALELAGSYLSSRPMYARIEYANKASSPTVNTIDRYDVYGEISTASLMLVTKYHLFNYKRFSPYIGASVGLRKNFGMISLYDTPQAEKTVDPQDFSLLTTRNAKNAYLSTTTTSSDDVLISNMFNSVQDFFNAFSYTVEAGTQFYLVDNLILNVSFNYSNYRTINVMRKTLTAETKVTAPPVPPATTGNEYVYTGIDGASAPATTTAFTINGPTSWGVSIGLQYQF